MSEKLMVSFDFDGTLQLPIIQKIAKRHILAGDEVFITTTRHPTHLPEYDSSFLPISFKIGKNWEVFKIAKKLGILENNIRFTKGEDKIHFLNEFDIHYDDDEYEIDLLTTSKIKCVGILINYKNYNVDS